MSDKLVVRFGTFECTCGTELGVQDCECSNCGAHWRHKGRGQMVRAVSPITED